MLLTVGCQMPEPSHQHEVVKSLSLTLQLPTDSRVPLADLRFEPQALVTEKRKLSPTTLQVQLEFGPEHKRFVVSGRGVCPQTLDLTELALKQNHLLKVTPWLDYGQDRAQVGYDSAFELRVEPGCLEATSGTITWKQVEGRPLLGAREDLKGFLFRAKTPPMSEFKSDPLPWGIVPISAAERGKVVLEATWRGASGPTLQRRVVVAAAARANGIPAIGVGQTVFLGKGEWRVNEAPEGATLGLGKQGEQQTFTSDVLGRWELADAKGQVLSVSARRYDRTRLDCGRATCHTADLAEAESSHMTRTLYRGLEGELGKDFDPRCGIECHAIGEPGVPDGGFMHVAWEMGTDLPQEFGPGSYAEMPRILRNLSGVGCTLCHGPGAVPLLPDRWSILRSEVCAVCHDEPPRYTTVAEWKSGAMAHSDAKPEQREGDCATCHTAAGYLEALGIAFDGARKTPEGEGPTGISCAVCHTAHGDDIGLALVRRFPLKALDSLVPKTASWGVCLSCHLSEDRSQSSASNVVLGYGALDLETGAQWPAQPTHEGCTTCHMQNRSNHSFVAQATVCAPCHAEPPTPDPQLRVRALAAWDTLVKRGVIKDSNSPHRYATSKNSEGGALHRATWNLSILLSDNAAAVHNGAFARRVLDAVEAALAR